MMALISLLSKSTAVVSTIKPQIECVRASWIPNTSPQDLHNVAWPDVLHGATVNLSLLLPPAELHPLPLPLRSPTYLKKRPEAL